MKKTLESDTLKVEEPRPPERTHVATQVTNPGTGSLATTVARPQMPGLSPEPERRSGERGLETQVQETFVSEIHSFTRTLAEKVRPGVFPPPARADDTTGKGANPFAPTEFEHAAVLEAIRLSPMERLLEVQDLVARTLRDRYEQTVAVLFSDIAGSSEYFERQGDAAGRFMVARHEQLVLGLAHKHGGRLVKSLGDGVLATFPSAPRAVAAAIQIQRGVHEANGKLPSREQYQVRIGVHYGAVLVNDVDRDVFGDTVNVSASVQSHAKPSQILVTDAVRNNVAAGLAARDAGEFQIKGRPRPQRLFEVLWQDPLRTDTSRDSTQIEIPSPRPMVPLPDEPLSLALEPSPRWKLTRWWLRLFRVGSSGRSSTR